MDIGRRKAIRLIVVLACLLLVAIVSLSLVPRRPEPALVRKFDGKMIFESRHFGRSFREYLVKGDAEEMIIEIRRELIPQGWRVQEGTISEIVQGQRLSGPMWTFTKGGEAVFFEPSVRKAPEHRITLSRQMNWIEKQWHEALNKVGLRNRYMSVR